MGGYYPHAKFAQNYQLATCRVRRLDAPMPRQRHDMNLWDLHPTFATYHNLFFYATRVSAFSFYLKKKTPAKEKQNRGNPPCTPANAAPQYLARGSQSVARHIRTQARRSLNGCVLVRLASQAVPSLSSVSYYCCGTAIISLIIKAASSRTLTLQRQAVGKNKIQFARY